MGLLRRLALLLLLCAHWAATSTSDEQKIFVDDEEDSSDPVDNSELERCLQGMSPCSLRAAILACTQVPAAVAVRIVLPRAHIKLAAQLPTLKRSIFLIGAARQHRGSERLPSPAADSGKAGGGDPRGEDQGQDQVHQSPDGRGIAYPLTTVLDGQGRHGILQAESDVFLVMENVHFKGGSAEAGGAVFTDGALKIVNCHFTDNKAVNGGAIYAKGPLEILSSTAELNSARDCGGVIYYTALLTIGTSVMMHNSDAGTGSWRTHAMHKGGP